MMNKARKLKELQERRRRGKLSAVQYAEEKGRLIAAAPPQRRAQPKSGVLLGSAALENGRDFVLTAVVYGMIGVALISVLMLVFG